MGRARAFERWARERLGTADVLKFKIYNEGRDAPPVDMSGAYLIGADGVPARGELHLRDNVITCESRNQEALGISLLWPVSGYGAVQLQTTRLPTRVEPYNLHTELVRHRLMCVSVKREEWGLFEYPGLEKVSGMIDRAQELFVELLRKAEDPPTAARIADKALLEALAASEELCRFHASVFLDRRKQTSGFGKNTLGVAVATNDADAGLGDSASDVFDFIRVPFVWRELQPDDRVYKWRAVDRWIERGLKSGKRIAAGPVLNFGVQFVPDWMYTWENDYEAISGFAREHVRQTVQRYADRVDTWVAASGLHADNAFSFNFEQIIDLSRMAAGVIKEVAPKSQVVLDLIQPWGEYFARNQRTVPPILYAEMAVQSGIKFDAFGLQFIFGMDVDGFHLRDLMQISTLIDRLANMGRPLHVTAVAAPSAKPDAGPSAHAWSEDSQAKWLMDFVRIALSKPYVESVCLQSLWDGACAGAPFSGVLREDRTPKPALAELGAFKQYLAES